MKCINQLDQSCLASLIISCYSDVNNWCFELLLIYLYISCNAQMTMSNHQADIESPNVELPRGPTSSLTKSWVNSHLIHFCRSENSYTVSSIQNLITF